MIKKSVLFLGFSIFAFSAFAQEITLPNLPGYKKVTDYPVYTADNLWDFIDGAADVYLSYGFEDVHVAEYKKGRDVIKLEIYKHKDETQAFGIYSSERSSTFDFISVGTQGYRADASLNFFKGKYYVKIRAFSKSERVLQSVNELALKVANMLQGESEMPAILKEFPDAGKKKNEETFIKESVLGHVFLSEAFKALYDTGNSQFSIFLIRKKSFDEVTKTVTTYLKSAGIEPNDQMEGKYLFKDGYNGDIFLSWKENTIVIISGLAKDQSDIASRYSSEILR